MPINVLLSQHFEIFVQELLATRHFNNVNEFILAGLRLFGRAAATICGQDTLVEGGAGRGHIERAFSSR